MQFSIIAIATFALTALAAPTGGGGNGGSDGCNGPQKTKGCCNTKTVLGVEIISDLLTCVVGGCENSCCTSDSSGNFINVSCVLI